MLKKKYISRLLIIALILQLCSTTLIFANSDNDFFTIGFFPDTQFLTTEGSLDRKKDHFERMLQFFVDNKNKLNLKIVSHLGDMTHNNNAPGWSMLDKVYNTFRDNNIPFSPARGNHDHNKLINKYFPISYFQNKHYFGGYKNGIENAYYIISHNGEKYLILVMDYYGNSAGPDKYDNGSHPDWLIDWANKVLSNNKDKKAIVVSHTLNGGVKKVIRNNKNVFMGIQGHITKDIYVQEKHNGVTKHLFVFDYQSSKKHFKGSVIKYFTFKPSEDKVFVKTYSIAQNKYLTNSSSNNGTQLSFDLIMDSNGNSSGGNDNNNTIDNTEQNILKKIGSFLKNLWMSIFNRSDKDCILGIFIF